MTDDREKNTDLGFQVSAQPPAKKTAGLIEEENLTA